MTFLISALGVGKRRASIAYLILYAPLPTTYLEPKVRAQVYWRKQ